MKMRVIYLLIILIGCQSYSQIKVADSLKIADLEIPNSPALTLLDKSFSIIETSNTSNSVNVNLINIKDNSLEIVPYWFFNKNKYYSAEEYFGFSISNNVRKQNIFNDIKKLTVSAAYTTSDTCSSIAFAVKTNIITIRNIKSINKKFEYYSTYNDLRNDYVKDNTKRVIDTILNFDSLPDQEKIKIAQIIKSKLRDEYDSKNKEENEEVITNFLNAFNHKVFTLDLASGAGFIFPDNKTDTGRLGKYGVWSTAKYSAILSDDAKDYFNIYGYSRLLFDNSILDIDNVTYLKNKYVDIGGKLEFQFNKVSISAEYLNRNGDSKDYRLVGTIQYKVQENLYLTGGYGKNFDTDAGNLISLFGLRWGLSEKPIAKLN